MDSGRTLRPRVSTPFIPDICDFFDTDSSTDSSPRQQGRASNARKGIRKKKQSSTRRPHSKIVASTPLPTDSVTNFPLLSSQESQSSQSSVRKRTGSVPLRTGKKQKAKTPRKQNADTGAASSSNLSSLSSSLKTSQTLAEDAMTPKIGCNINTPSQDTGLTQELGSIEIQTEYFLTADENKQLITQVFPAPGGPFDSIPTDIQFWEDVWKQITRLRPKLYRTLSGKTGNEFCAALTSEIETFVKTNVSSGGF